MAIRNVTVQEDCTSCGLCVDICPDVFDMEDIAFVKKGVDFGPFEDEIREAADSCPAEVIIIDD